MTTQVLMTRRSALALGAGTLIAPRLAIAAAAQPVLVELFTSQGCSSCPPADKLAGTLAEDPNNIVVSFNVDYWDYLGWRDTLAKPEYSQRQYDYAKSRGDSSVYTPQMVINGKTHAVGSNGNEVAAQIANGIAETRPATIILKMTSKQITVEIAASDYKGDATLWFLAVEPEVEQKITRGENSGSSISYVNVVRNLVPAAMWNGETYKGAWMRDAVMVQNCKTLIAVLQQNKVGPVLGLARA